ncbi:hypothetical protein ACFQZR_20655 [Paenibacillus sp. GCM10027629]|uniref:hypothetical protein n=1 Tax=Paenibacillus sp. GCM10027629 TaxID=3273414 RepID=UPI0036374413
MNDVSNFEAVRVKRNEIKLVGIPFVGGRPYADKGVSLFNVAKHSLLTAAEHFPGWINRDIVYSVLPSGEKQLPDTFSVIVAIEIENDDMVPEWFTKINIPPTEYGLVSDIPIADERQGYQAMDRFFETSMRVPEMVYGHFEVNDANKPGFFDLYTATRPLS